MLYVFCLKCHLTRIFSPQVVCDVKSFTVSFLNYQVVKLLELLASQQYRMQQYTLFTFKKRMKPLQGWPHNTAVLSALVHLTAALLEVTVGLRKAVRSALHALTFEVYERHDQCLKLIFLLNTKLALT